MEMRGKVSSGLGRAHMFMAQQHYQEQFKAILGVTAWPGTLNLEVEGDSLVSYSALRELVGIGNATISTEMAEVVAAVDVSFLEPLRIVGFEREGRSFGGATAFVANLRLADGEYSVPCAILIPDLTRHTDVVEVIAAAFLREEFNLQDGDEMVISTA